MAVLDTRILLVPARCANKVDAENISPASGSKKNLVLHDLSFLSGEACNPYREAGENNR